MHKAATGLQMLQKLTLTLTASAGKINAYVRLLFIKFSSAFHTTIPGGELRLLGLDTCKWNVSIYTCSVCVCLHTNNLANPTTPPSKQC